MECLLLNNYFIPDTKNRIENKHCAFSIIDDAAAVSCILAKYQQPIQGHNSKVIKYDIYDKFGFY